ncbi:winged helix-turn-helix domain-containing protein [Propionicicella superfundia]|uniref:winged helix-turn-helix domain-containing protein n=1 Tax=Propionicicella superfundia TaxID=348582 RepID=UPI00041D92D6|nr:crosslink repair DNA glycosylase YcaQ family protein [Propionicicella superfundia]
MTHSLSGEEARRAALAAQGFTRPRPVTPGTRQLNLVLRRMGTLQIDSVNVFARSHYLPPFSRLGGYDPETLDRLLLGMRSPYVEYWAHVASFIPLQDWGLFAFRMDAYARRDAAPDSWVSQHRDVVDRVRAELAARGTLRPSEIDHDGDRRRRGPWWDWDVVKLALEHLWRTGEVAVPGRKGFERCYALAEDVIPADARAAVPHEDAVRELVRRAARSYGVATIADLADYWRLRNRSEVTAALRDLEAAGEVSPVTVAGWGSGGRPGQAWLHRDAVVPRRVDAAALLTPFDPVVWFRPRAERLFGFHYRIELYTPAHKRRYGYYSLPVLVGDRIVARVDLAADRATRTLRVQSAWWEGIAPSGTAERIAAEVRLAARWQGLDGISVSRWGDAADDLAAALVDAERHEHGPHLVRPAE